jgi:UDP-N-acetylglucosamine 2-epimerase (non-hydrolysing)
MKILNVVGARPNFMKISPIISAIRHRSVVESAHGGLHIEQYLVHTGQHYDQELSGLFFDQLGIPSPDVNLGVGSGSHAVQTAEIMKKFETVCLEQKPSIVLVVGDVNSTIACALVAVKLGIPTVHVEAGLRSFDRTMPEEINRVLTDAISDQLFTTEESANENLRREGIPERRIHFVGNVMIDSLLHHREKAEESTILTRLALARGTSDVRPYGVLTLHRPSTVDDPKKLMEVIEAVIEVSRDLPIVFPVHPRTRSRITACGLQKQFGSESLCKDNGIGESNGIIVVQPLGYLDFLRLTSCARVVLTDSGGIQEETTILGVPCVTLRDCTERPVTLTQGTNVLAGVSKGTIVERTQMQLQRGRRANSVQPPLWDGKAATRIVDVLVKNDDFGSCR